MANKIRVAFFVEIMKPQFDGAARTIFELIKRIPEQDYEFKFFCAVGPDGDFKHEVVKFPDISIPFNKDYKIGLPYFGKNSLKKELDQFNPDVIHISTPSILGNHAVEYAHKHHIPVISIYHTHFISYIDYYFRNAKLLIPMAKNYVKTTQKSFYNHCDTIYVPTKSMVQELSAMGIHQDKMTIWPRGLNLKNFNPKKKDKTFIQNLTGNTKPNLLFASRLVWEKNLETLIGIYELIEKNKSEYNFIVAGDGVASQEVRQRMPNAIFTGNVNHEQLAVLYASADVFVFTSVTETYGNVVVEAMASGLPCVIANGGGSADFIENGKNGFLCSPMKPEEYLTAINKILTNGDLKSAIIQAGIEQTISLDWEKLAEKYFKDLKKMAIPYSVAV
jgi:glycosyltransferase involved in cell wall biosynthesis